MNTMKIAPSILSADYANFESELKRLEACVRIASWSLIAT